MLHPTFRLGLLLSVTALRLKSLVWRCIIRWGGRGWGRSFLSRTYPRSRRHRHQQLWNILQVRSIALHVQEDVVASLPGRCSCCCCSCGRSIAIAACTHVVVVVIGYCRCHLIFIWLVYLFNLWSAVGFLVGAILREYFLLRNSSFLPLFVQYCTKCGVCLDLQDDPTAHAVRRFYCLQLNGNWHICGETHTANWRQFSIQHLTNWGVYYWICRPVHWLSRCTWIGTTKATTIQRGTSNTGVLITETELTEPRPPSLSSKWPMAENKQNARSLQ